MVEIILYFAKYQDEMQLERTLYVDSFGSEIVAVRGKTAGAYRNAGTFQWTPAVKALAIVFLTALTRDLKQIQTVLPLLEGGRGSLASSLDYALSKQPAWLCNMFGSDDQGDASLRKLLFRSNSGLKRAGSVGISLNESLLDPRYIKVYFEGRLVLDTEELKYLMKSILREQKNSRTEILTSTKYNNCGEQQNSLRVLGKSFGINQSIRSVGLSSMDNIYLFEQLQYPGS